MIEAYMDDLDKKYSEMRKNGTLVKVEKIDFPEVCDVDHGVLPVCPVCNEKMFTWDAGDLGHTQKELEMPLFLHGVPEVLRQNLELSDDFVYTLSNIGYGSDFDFDFLFITEAQKQKLSGMSTGIICESCFKKLMIGDRVVIWDYMGYGCISHEMGERNPFDTRGFLEFSELDIVRFNKDGEKCSELDDDDQ